MLALTRSGAPKRRGRTRDAAAAARSACIPFSYVQSARTRAAPRAPSQGPPFDADGSVSPRVKIRVVDRVPVRLPIAVSVEREVHHAADLSEDDAALR